MFSAIGLIALAVWFPVTMLTASGISNTRASYLDVARTLGASRNFLIFRTWPLNKLFKWAWERPAKKRGVEGINLADSRAVKDAVSVPVLCTGGFQTASVVAGAISRGDCDGVTIGRPLIANPDLVRLWESGVDAPPKPCTYSNKCLINQLENPLGCYDESRF